VKATVCGLVTALSLSVIVAANVAIVGPGEEKQNTAQIETNLTPLAQAVKMKEIAIGKGGTAGWPQGPARELSCSKSSQYLEEVAVIVCPQKCGCGIPPRLTL
jgi:hypothetical protein